jgi:hypothetical protein
VLIYVPGKRPQTDEQKQVDPFALYAECGAVFPQDDGDEYLSLCLRAKPDHATDIRRVFSETSVRPCICRDRRHWWWRQLAAIARHAGCRIGPRDPGSTYWHPIRTRPRHLKAQEGWVQEARDFLRATLAMTVKTRGKTWASLADELWRYVLFSEFVFDLPVRVAGNPQGRAARTDGGQADRRGRL